MDIQAMRLGDRLAESIRKLNELDQLRAGDK
jgi:hypothetical protein